MEFLRYAINRVTKKEVPDFLNKRRGGKNGEDLVFEEF